MQELLVFYYKITKKLFIRDAIVFLSLFIRSISLSINAFI